MRRRRTIYHNDARHSYLWHFEPPMRLEDAWIPIDEVAGTAVDTFSYCVERGDGAFYPTKVGKMFAVEDGKPQAEQNYVWRAAACMLRRRNPVTADQARPTGSSPLSADFHQRAGLDVMRGRGVDGVEDDVELDERHLRCSSLRSVSSSSSCAASARARSRFTRGSPRSATSSR